MTPEQEKELRQKFSKVLGAPQGLPNWQSSMVDARQVIYSWEEIFCEIGKILARGKVENVGTSEGEPW